MASTSFFTPAEMASVRRFAEFLIPWESGSPGAVDFGVHEFIDELVSASPRSEQQAWRRGLTDLAGLFVARFECDLWQATDSQMEALLRELLNPDSADGLASFTRYAKSVVIKAYYRTEHGMHVELGIERAEADRSTADRTTSTSHLFNIRDDFREAFDVIVVGSGATGGWAAKELTEAGYDVLMLDAGGLPPTGQMPKQPYELRYKNMFDNTTLNGSRQSVQSRSWACDEYRGRYFIDDVDHPYDGSENFTWIRGSFVGGRMNMWGRQVYRFSEQEFSPTHMNGQVEAWPLGYDDLAPFYDEVEEFIGVSGACDGVPNLPDGRFLPPMEMTDGEKHLKTSVENRWPERKVIIGRTATLTRDHRGRKACEQRGHCYRGCPNGSFFEPFGSTLAAASATGRLLLRANAPVSRLVMDEERGRANGVAFVDPVTNGERLVRARAVVLAASTLSSTRILMSSRVPHLPGGVGSSSGMLGSFLHGHLHSIMCAGRVPWLLKPVGVHDEGRPNQIYIPQFLNNRDQEHKDGFVGGFGIEGAVKHYMFPRDMASRSGFGVELKRSIRSEPVSAHYFLTAFGAMLPRADNRIRLSDRRDKHGLPTLEVNCSYGENDRRMAEAMADAVTDIAREAKFEIDLLSRSPGSPGLCVHEVGTARMGADRTRSVLDPFNRVWDAPNVLVVDGASFPSSGPQNPTLTMMALSLRAARRLAQDLKQSHLF